MELIKIILLAFCLFVAVHEGAVLITWRYMSELEREVERKYAVVYSIIIIIGMIGVMI